jgi:hypothetical protein
LSIECVLDGLLTLVQPKMRDPSQEDVLWFSR